MGVGEDRVPLPPKLFTMIRPWAHLNTLRATLLFRTISPPPDSSLRSNSIQPASFPDYNAHMTLSEQFPHDLVLMAHRREFAKGLKGHQIAFGGKFSHDVVC